MHYLWLTFLSVSFASALALRNSSDLSGTLPSLINATNSSILSADRKIVCDRNVVEGGNFERSCLDALRNMAFVAGPVTQQFIWGPRGTATKYDVYMPQRVVSCMSSESIMVFLLTDEESLSGRTMRN